MLLKKLIISFAIVCIPFFAFSAGSVAITGTITTNHSEQDIIIGGQTITLRLTSATWISTVADSTNLWKAVFSSSGNWSSVSAAITSGSLTRVDDTTFTIILPATSAYLITADEVVTITIPNSLLATGNTLNTPTFTITNLNPVLTLSGTASPSLSESNIRAGSFTVIFDLQYDTWQATLGANNALSTAFLAGISGNQDWSTVAGALSYTNITRNSATRITLTLPAVATYVITSNETVSFAIPAGSYVNGTARAATDPTIIVNNLNPQVTISGTATPSLQETNIHTGGYTVIFDVQYDTWHSTIGANNSVSTSFLAGITGDKDWSTVTTALTYANLTRNSATRLTLTLPAIGDYSIIANETVSINVPAGSFTGAAGVNSGVAFSVINQLATASATWSTALTTQTEAQVRAGGLTLTLVCSNNWNTSLSVLKTQFIAGLDGGAGSDWNTKILPNITVTHPSAKTVIISFAGDASFDISALKTINYAIPGAALATVSGAQITTTPVSFSISPASTSVSISPVSINESILNGATVDVVLSEETFSNPAILDVANFSLSTTPSNTSIVSVTNKTSTSARLTLAYSGDIDISGSLAVTVLSGLTGGGTLVSNTATIVPVIEPVITLVSIPNQTYKIGDNVPVTITVQNDGGQTFSLTAGTIGGRTITGLARTNVTTYTASFSILSGTTDFAAVSDIPVSIQMQVSGRSGNLYSTAISQNSDLIDANAPIISTYQALGTVYKVGDIVQLVANADQPDYTVDNAQTSINGIPYSSSFFELLSEFGGSYYFTYQVSENDNDVANPASLTGQIALKDAAGNISAIKVVSAISGSFKIDAHSPTISLVTSPDSTYIPGETLIFTLNTNGSGYTLSSETFINGISLGSGRFSFTGAGPTYSLNYTILSGDAVVSKGNISVNIVLKDAAGNKSNALTAYSNNSAIYTTKPTANISGNNSICLGDSASLFINLAGKSNWNIIVSDGSANIPFNNITTSPFSFKVAPIVSTNYSVLSVSDNYGLTNTGTGNATISIKLATPVNISALGSAYSVESPAINLSAIPSGGQFSGPGVVGSANKFYPAIAGILASPHKIIYTYPNEFGCVSHDSVIVSVVQASGSINMGALYCYNSTPSKAVATTGNPSVIGSFHLQKGSTLIPEGSGIHDNGNNTATISPELLSPDDYVLVYKYFVSDTLSLSKNFRIESIEPPKIIGLPVSICENSTSINLDGDAAFGSFKGTGIIGNSISGFKFDPSISGDGKFLIIYSDSTVNGCKSSIATEIRVFYVPQLGFTANDRCVLSSQIGSDITFMNTSVEKDSVKYWNWEFDDVNSGALNFSNEVSPTHIFKKSGKYSIALSDSTNNGCFSQKEITLDFGDRPVGFFEAINKCFTPGSVTEFLSSTSSDDAIKSYSWKLHLPSGKIIDSTVYTPEFNFQFLESGKYFVEHLVTSNTDCILTLSDSVTLQPTILLKAGVPFNEAFDANDGGWSRSQIDDTKFPGQSWKWGNADFLNLPNDIKHEWFTNRDSSQIPELSYLVSPCFNISELERPMARMNIYRNFTSPQDGVILKTSTDNGLTWLTLGNPGDGINWYSDYQTSNYAFGSNFGWANIAGSSADTGWIESRHILDPVGGSVNLQFRLEFGARESAIPNYQGFAINNFSIRERERFSVLEHFTNTTTQNPNKEKLVKGNAKVNTLYKKDDLYKDFVKLEYHTRFPSSNDSLNIFNRDVPGSRAFYYGITSVPYSILDGGDRTGRRFDFTDTKYEPKEVDINLRSLEDPPVELTVTANTSGNQLSVNVKLKALKNMVTAERVLYVILYETRVSGYNPGNGELQFQNVVRSMLPGAGGSAVYQSLRATPSDTSRLEFNFTADISNLNKEKIRVAVYLQDDLSGEIYQVSLSDHTRSLGTGVHPSIIYKNSINVYPNPATDFVQIKVSGRIDKSSRIELFDQLGRKIRSEEIPVAEGSITISTSDLVKGVYYLRMASAGIPGSETVKLVIIN